VEYPVPAEPNLIAVIGTDTTPSSAALRHVARAKACPWCGNPKVVENSPRSCSRCHRNIGLAIEHDELPCPSCGEALVSGAEFCHHCTKWLKGYAEPAGEELGVA
jgi:predicted RNA-binding Zn-ribbon protein involved in translation (DUF1610 family)